MAAWEQQLRQMFIQHDKDMSGEIGREDIVCMLLNASKKDKEDPVFKTHLRFLIETIKSADKDGDLKITFEEFKQYITKAITEASAKDKK
ncbi:Protein T03F1.11 [Aphelenchoides avenae]|nr:Protein T03F1.11 [Aphelenchus avenae]